MGRTASAAAGLLGLADIAQLAGVQRPVVSMWRRRPRAGGRVVPFPAAREVVDGHELFALGDVVAYLASTGRGKNAEAALDGPTITAPQTADLDDALALLCLGALTGTDLAASNPADLVALAARVDPDDAFLLREVAGHGWPPDLLGHVDELRSGSFGPRDALARLDRGPLARRRAQRAGSAALTALVAVVAQACGTHLAMGAPGTTPLLALAGEQFLGEPEGSPFGSLLVCGDSAGRRHLWRRAVLMGWSVIPEPSPAPVVRITSVVGLTTASALTQVDDVVLGLRPQDAAVVIGSAETLTDALAGPDERIRAAIVRPGCLTAALRLPRGWSRAAYRQSLALWVVTGRPGADADADADADAVRVADLEGAALELRDLSADVTAALMREATRQYRYLRRRPLAPVLAGGSLVPRGSRALRLDVGDGDALLARVRDGARRTADPVSPFEVFVAPAPSRVVLPTRSLGELHEAEALGVRRGVRIDAAWHDDHGSVEVWTASGPTGVRMDPFEADRRYPRALRTEASDVVFEEKPRPRAVVDRVGGSLVASPARVLRLTGRVPVGPHLLADRINRAAPGIEWRTIELPDLPHDVAGALDAALAAAATHRAELVHRLATVDDVTAALVEGVTAGVLVLPERPHIPPKPQRLAITPAPALTKNR